MCRIEVSYFNFYIVYTGTAICVCVCVCDGMLKCMKCVTKDVGLKFDSHELLSKHSILGWLRTEF